MVKMIPEPVRGRRQTDLAKLKRRAARARRFPVNTCGASRHVHLMADCILKGDLAQLADEPEHCAESMYATIAALWEARTKLRKLEKRK
jgi:hypothetical protein